MLKRRTHEDYLQEISLVYGNEYTILGVYKNAKTKLEYKHSCGNVLIKTPDSVKSNGLICRSCYKPNYKYEPQSAITRVNNKSKEFYKKFELLSGGQYELLSEYTGTKNHIKIKCLRCGIINNQRPSDFLQGKRCQECSRKNAAAIRVEKAKSKIEDRLISKYGENIKLISEYRGANKYCKFECKICNYTFETTPVSILNKMVKFGCPMCSRSSSGGEKKIKEFLEINKIPFKTQYTFTDLAFKNVLRFDFAVISEQTPILLIEYDGIQHFKPVGFFGGEKRYQEEIIRDSLKDKYCQEKGLKLIRIPYYEYENIEKILERSVSGF